MTTLVTGGTGFIGGAVARELAGMGESVRVLARKGEPEDPAQQISSVEWVAGDLLDPVSLRYALEGCDRVYHIAGHVSTHPNERDIVRAVNYEGTINLFDAALAAKVRRVIYTGSIFALGVGAEGAAPADESVTYNLSKLRAAYFRAKREAELAVDGYGARGLDIVTVYPGFCAGPGDRHLTSSRLIVAYLRRQLPAYLPGGLCQVDVRDAAHAHVLAMTRGKVGGRYLATGHNVTYRGIFQRLAHITGRTPPTLRLPVAPLGLAGAALERLSAKPLLDGGVVQLLHHTWWYNDFKARRDLGIEYRPLEDTYADAVAWFLQQGFITAKQAGVAEVQPVQSAAPSV
ncbi:MAG: NAD-dependent epimerase/dehydratase family protein [Ktedonobacterales bacterium]|nr:NAD-dependent epimerase/dehydratase family protein [Ktedonobacterales bacterium]